jgi:hypothetical protein
MDSITERRVWESLTEGETLSIRRGKNGYAVFIMDADGKATKEEFVSVTALRYTVTDLVIVAARRVLQRLRS